MNKKSFFLGVVTGVVITLVGLFALIGLAYLYSEGSDTIEYLDKPMSYENKTESSFKVFQVLDSSALATEESNRIGKNVMYYGNTVVILGKSYYSGQIITIKNPMRVGTHSYTNNAGIPMTVPVIDGEFN